MDSSAPTTGAMDKLAPALAAAQGEMTNPKKTKTALVRMKSGGTYKYRYADLSEILDHVRPVLSRHKLAVTQLVLTEAARTVLLTRLLHESGQYLDATYLLPTGAAAQEMGSAVTYARRYSLSAILGIAAEDDDDGEKANDAGAGAESDAEKIARDELIERMGLAGLGNHAVMSYAAANGIGNGDTVEALSLDAAQNLLSNWDRVVEQIRDARKKAPPAADTTPVRKVDAEAAPDDLAGIAADLAALMRRDGITAAMLRDYYTKAGHFTAAMKMTPQKLPPTYIKGITNPENWKKATAKMKETAT